MHKRSGHDKTLGLEMTLTKKEGMLEEALKEQEERQRQLLSASAEVERLTSGLSEALKREENLRKHSEAIGQVFQMRLLELQGKHASAEAALEKLEKELMQVRAQRDQEVAACAAMFKNLEHRAIKETSDTAAIQQASAYIPLVERV